MINNATITVICDNPGCEAVEELDLDYLSHAWSDLSEMDLEDAGWVTVDDNNMQFCCEECAAEYFAKQVKG